MAGREAWQRQVVGRRLPPYFSCIFSRMGTIMSNLGRLAGSSFMQIFISLHMCGDMPGGMVGRSPSSATWEQGRAGRDQKPVPSPACDRQTHSAGRRRGGLLWPPGLPSLRRLRPVTPWPVGLYRSGFPALSSPSCLSPCWTSLQTAPHGSPAPTAAPRSSTCRLSAY